MTKIINLGKIVCLIKKFGNTENKVAKNEFLEEIIKNQVVGEGICQISIYRKHMEICKKLNLVQEEYGSYKLTDDGVKFYHEIPIECDHKIIDKKTDGIKKILIEKLSNFLNKECSNVEVNIRIQNGNEYFFTSDKEIKKINREFLKLLKDLELIKHDLGKFSISDNIIKSFPKRKMLSVSEDELYKILEKQREIGLAAEEETIRYEKNRLNDLGKVFLIDKIKRISKEKTDAGYDIESFNGEEISFTFDRFIEVKATSGHYPIFYWSENEIEVAKLKGNQYFIYIWINFGKTNQELLAPIQNPYQKIWKNDLIKKDAVTTWRVTWHE